MPQSTQKKRRIPQFNYIAASDKHAEFHNAWQTPVRILCGGVGASKSFPACFEILHHLINNPVYNGSKYGKASKALVVGLTDKHNREQLLPHFLAILNSVNKRGQQIGFQEKVNFWYTVSPLKLWFSNGAEIMFHSVEGGATLPGFNVAIVLVDEIDKGNQQTWNDAFDRMGRQIGNPNGFLIGTCNPGSRSHWLAKTYFAHYEDTATYDDEGRILTPGETPQGVDLWQLSIYDNPHMKHKWAQWEAQYGYSDLERKKKLLGRFVNMEGLVFGNWDRDKHCYPALPANQIHSDDRVKSAWPRYRGLDFGGVDKTACVWVARNPEDDTFYLYREYYQSGRSPQQNTEAINSATSKFEAIQGTYSDHEHSVYLAYRDAGLLLTKATKGAGSIEAGIGLIRQLLDQGKLKIRDDCKHLIEEIESYQYDDKTGKIKNGQKDHLIDATRYCLWELSGKGSFYAMAPTELTKFEPSSGPDIIASGLEQADSKAPEGTIVFAYESDGSPIYVRLA